MIYITQKLRQQIQKESEKCYPNECCGILFGKLDDFSKTAFMKRVEDILPITNSSEEVERYHRFLITPEMMMQAELEARKRKQDIVGFYHSHPNKPAFPSEYDREHALPVYSYIIASVVLGITVEINSFELSVEDEIPVFYPEDIQVVRKQMELKNSV